VILADTSIWIDHFRKGDAALTRLLDQGEIWIHPFIVGEIALGSLQPRAAILRALRQLPAIAAAHPNEVLLFIERHRLFGAGIGYTDAHLLAAVALTPGTLLWTRDKRLQAAAARLSCMASLP
jgi:predicted nucleic acid-binding protein